MLSTFSAIHLLYLGIAIVLEVAANIFIKLSHGFKRKVPAFIAIVCVLLAFTALSFAIRGIQLSVAYSLWGGIGLIATALLGMMMFDERVRLSGWIGMIVIVIGVVLVKLS